MPARIEISRDIAASPDAVYAAISDVTRMGEWSEECHACEWRDVHRAHTHVAELVESLGIVPPRLRAVGARLEEETHKHLG